MKLFQIFAFGTVFGTATILVAAPLAMAQNIPETPGESSPPSLTIYNKGFSVVREILRLNLRAGESRINFDRATAYVEPDSVILRDITGQHPLRILEQNYRGDPLSQELLLSTYEGKSIPFVIRGSDGQERTVTGKIIRSGYIPRTQSILRNASGYSYNGGVVNSANQPIIEIEGSLRFGLPGIPVFPALGKDTILKPTLSWTLATDKPGLVEAEVSYITGGMAWEADYNLVAPETGDLLQFTGLVTIENQSGRAFDNARLKLMAGDVNKIQPSYGIGGFGGGGLGGGFAASPAPPAVTERTFDEYHLYTLERPTTLRDRETKQVEFVQSQRVAAKRIYVYEGVKLDPSRYYDAYQNRQDRSYGTVSNPKVWVMREFLNTKANGLGIPLPKGRVRFYRRDAKGGALEFTGENVIDHTPQGETVRVYTGDAFDIVGERRQVSFKSGNDSADEAFEIKVRNRKKEPVTVRVVERLYRWINWEITAKTSAFSQKDSRTIEFPVTIAPDQEKIITYTVHYTW